jgi:uncharacterized protein
MKRYADVLKSISVSGKTLLDWSGALKKHMLVLNKEFDSGHRIDHVERVLANALKLYENEAVKPKLEVIVPAVWLHDCVPIEKKSPDRPKASQISSDAAVQLLEGMGYEPAYLSGVKQAILSHSFSACKRFGYQPESLEAQIVQDADRLDALGTIGIARVYLIGGKFGNQVYHPDDPFAASGRALEETVYVVDHFYEKLLGLWGTMQTASGRVVAKERTRLMHDHLRSLGDEIGVPYPYPPEFRRSAAPDNPLRAGGQGGGKSEHVQEVAGVRQ